jgi:hypothetical protein
MKAEFSVSAGAPEVGAAEPNTAVATAGRIIEKCPSSPPCASGPHPDSPQFYFRLHPSTDIHACQVIAFLRSLNREVDKPWPAAGGLNAHRVALPRNSLPEDESPSELTSFRSATLTRTTRRTPVPFNENLACSGASSPRSLSSCLEHRTLLYRSRG